MPKSRQVKRKFFIALPAVLLTAGLYYADTIIFAAPIVTLSLWLGPWPAFLICVPLYFLFDYGLGRLSLAIVSGTLQVKKMKKKGPVSRFLAKPVGWIQTWFESLEQSVPGKQIRKRLSATRGGRIARYASFVIASYFGTAFVTIPMIYLLGQRKYLRLLTSFSAAIYALTFVAPYALGTFLMLSLIKFLASQF